MKLAEFSVKNYQFTIIIFLMVLLLGLSALLNMPRGEDPPFNAPIFVVLAIYPGTSPKDMEELVAEPIEDAIYELDDIKKIITDCDDGIMLMRVEFSYGVDVDSKNNDVVREVNRLRTDLPEELAVLEVTRATSSDVAILQVALTSDNAPYSKLFDEAERLKKHLEKVPDLKKVEIQAYPEQRVEVRLDLERMTQYRVGANQLLGALQSSNLNIPGGSIDLGSRKFNVETNSQYEALDDIRNTVIQASPEGRILYLKDIADVELQDEDLTHVARYNGKKSVWVVAMLKDLKNIVQNDQVLKPALGEFERTLPAGIDLEVAFDQAVNVERRLSGLGRDFLIAVLLVLLTLLPLGWRASAVVMISIPLSLSIGLALLNLIGYSLNQLSIVGLVVSLGLLVDDSIVVVENIERFLRMGYSRKEAAVAATKQIGIAVVGCTATLILAFLPLAFLPEGSGDFIRSLPMAVILTIIASLFVAITIIPFLSSMLLRQHEQVEGNFFLRAFKRYLNDPYKKVLLLAFRFPWLSLLFTLLIFLGSLSLVPRIGFSLFPMSEKPMFMVDVNAPLGTSIEATDAIAQAVEKELTQHPLVVGVSTNVGKGNPRIYYNEFQKNNAPNYAQLFVQVKPHTAVPELTALTDTLRARFVDFAGAKIQVRRFQQGPPVDAPVEIRVLSEDLDSLRSWSLRVEQIMRSMDGLIYVNNPLRVPKTDLEVVIHKEKAGMLGIPVGEIARTIRLGLAGLEVSEFRTPEGKEYSIIVTVEENQQQALEVFSKIYVNSLSGAMIPLDQVARVSLKSSPSVLRHFNKERFAAVTAFVQTGYNTNALTDQLLTKLDALDPPPSVSFYAGGERETQAESFGGIETIIIIAVFGLLAILVLEFRTFKSTIIVLSVIPLGIIGALLMLFMIGETLSFVATVGMIALVGIEIKNSILLVDYTNQLREAGKPLEEAIVEGAETRFLPILLTTLTAIGGLTPLALERSPLISPLAYVLIGGLISSTLLSRVITPLLYKLLPPKVEVKRQAAD
ncbi:MAG: Multidrug resistance protein MdtC [Haliscomenobacter sp.]|jgi:multidrug efflux pump subunit AcrB|nr:Multidrug resistance protein MdtC [Haliscomenobacter sp.]